MLTSGVYFLATRIPRNPFFQGLAWWEMTMCVFLCVLFKTDGRFTLAEMGDKQLRKDEGNLKERDVAIPSSCTDTTLRPVVDIYDFLAHVKTVCL